MVKTIDCLLIGNYEMSIEEQIINVRAEEGSDSVKARDLELLYVKYKNKYYTQTELFNKFFYDENGNKDNLGHIKHGSTLSSAVIYLYNYLSKRGLAVQFINEFKSQRDELSQQLLQDNISSIAISTTFFHSPYEIKQIIKFIREINPKIKIILGGPFVITITTTLDDETVLQKYFSEFDADYYICSSEGETALVELVRAIKNQGDLDQIKNIYYRKGTEYKFTSAVLENNSFEDEVIDWSLFGDKLDSMINLRTAKSCPFSCAFCSFPSYAGPFRTAEVDIVEKMLDNISKYDKVTRISFVDDTINIPVNRYKEILRMMIKNKYKFKWKAYFRCQYADREMVELMKESGCECAFLGIESGSQTILNNLNKKATLEQYYNGLSLLNEYGITSFASLIIGFPGETYETFLNTKKFIEETKPTFFRARHWIYTPSSPIGKDKDKFELIGMYHNWSHKTMDSSRAVELLRDLILSIKNSVFINSDFDDYILMHLLERGLSLEKIKEFFTYYNIVLRDKILNPKSKGVSEEIAEKFREVCQK